MPAPVYLDNNATTRLDPRVLEAMLPWFTEQFGNAASTTHAYGWQAAEAVKIAREHIALAIHANRAEEIFFTSGATEADNLGLKGVAELYVRKGNHIITTTAEHSAVKDTCDYLEKIGKRITRLSVNREGLIDLEELKAALTEETVLVCILLANNETGVIQPMAEISELVHAAGSLLMTDATQAVGKIPVNVETMGIDLMAFSGHKLYGPKGVGALYVRRRNPRVTIAAQMHGGGHEGGFRSGTMNVPGIVGMGKAIELCQAEMAAEASRLKGLRDRLESALINEAGGVLNGHPEHRLPNSASLQFPGVDAEALIMAMRNLAVSTGSACTSASMDPSHVLTAMGLTSKEAYTSVRFSLGRFNTAEEVEFAIEEVKTAVARLRAMQTG